MIFGSLSPNTIKSYNMKQRVIFYALSVSLFSAISGNLLAQKGVEDGSRYGHGEDSIRCITNYSLYREYARQGDLKSALPYWRVVYNECPRVSKNLYIDGTKIFRDFIEKETNNEVQSKLIDTLMMIYDQRIKYYPRDKGDQLGRKGIDLLRYKRDDIEYVQKAYGYLEESIKLEKSEASEAVVATFLTASITLYQNDKLTEDKVIDDFLTCCNVFNAKISKSPANKQLTDIEKTLIDNFISLGLSCESLETRFSEYYNKDTENVPALGVIVDVMKGRNCSKSETYYQSARKIHPLSPTAESASSLGMIAFDRAEYSDAITYFKQATQLEEDNDKKATDYFWLAESQLKLNQKTDARESALKAAELKEHWGDPYILIGRMYIESSGDCSGISLPKAIYWVAVDKFIKAKTVDPGVEGTANQLILTYSKYFPSKEDAFFLGIHEGDSYTVGCWINETTKVRF